MRYVLLAFLLSGCAIWSDDDAGPTPPVSPPQSELGKLWELEVDDAVAGFTAIKPHIKFDGNSGELYDAQLSGLVALAGPPTVPAVQQKTQLIQGADGSDAIKRLQQQKEALDAKTTALEGKAREAEAARIAAEAKADKAAENARLSEASSNLSRVAAGAIGVGVLAFLFGSFLAIPRWAAASTVGIGVLVATTAPQLLSFFGSDHAKYIMAATFGIIALSAAAAACFKLWRIINPVKDEQQPEQ